MSSQKKKQQGAPPPPSGNPPSAPKPEAVVSKIRKQPAKKSTTPTSTSTSSTSSSSRVLRSRVVAEERHASSSLKPSPPKAKGANNTQKAVNAAKPKLSLLSTSATLSQEFRSLSIDAEVTKEEEEIAATKKKIAVTKKEIAEIAAKKKEFEAMKTGIEEMRRKIEAKEENIKEMRTGIEEMRKKIEEKERKIEAKERKIEAKEVNIKEMRRSGESTEMEQEFLKQERRALNNERNALEKERNALEQERSALEQERSALEQERSALKNKQREHLEADETLKMRQEAYEQNTERLNRLNSDLLALKSLLPQDEATKPLLPKLRSITEDGGKEPVKVLSELRQAPEDTPARSGILEFDRDTSPFFPDEAWTKVVQSKAGSTEKWRKNARNRMDASPLCKLLLQGGESGITKEELRRRLKSNQPDASMFDEMYLWTLVHLLLMLEERGTGNPLLKKAELLEGWFSAHILAPLLDRCFFELSDWQVVRCEGQARSSEMRRKEQTKERGKKAVGAKVDMHLILHQMAKLAIEVFFHEAKRPIATAEDAKKDRTKLLKEMKDGLFAMGKALKSRWNNEFMTFGVQSVGLDISFYSMDYSFREVSNCHLLHTCTFPEEITKDLECVLLAGCLLIEIKNHINKIHSILKKILQEVSSSGHHGFADDNDSDGGDNGEEEDDDDDDSDGGGGPKRRIHHTPSPSTATPKKPAKSDKKIAEALGLSTDIERDLEFDLQEGEETSLPDRRLGCPWYVDFAWRRSDGSLVAVKKLRYGWHPEEFGDREVSLHLLANRCGARYVVPLLATYKPRLGMMVDSQLALVFPRLVRVPLSARDRPDKRPLPLREVERIVNQICIALSDLHRIGIVHLDVSTWNVMLDPITWEARLIDFGHAELTHPGFTLLYTCGTKGFRAPEAKPGSPCLPQSDFYSTGVVLLHLLVQHLFPTSVGSKMLNNKQMGPIPTLALPADSVLQLWDGNRRKEGLRMTRDAAAAVASGTVCLVSLEPSDRTLLQRLCQNALQLTSPDPLQRIDPSMFPEPLVSSGSRVSSINSDPSVVEVKKPVKTPSTAKERPSRSSAALASMVTRPSSTYHKARLLGTSRTHSTFDSQSAISSSTGATSEKENVQEGPVHRNASCS